MFLLFSVLDLIFLDCLNYVLSISFPDVLYGLCLCSQFFSCCFALCDCIVIRLIVCHDSVCCYHNSSCLSHTLYPVPILRLPIRRIRITEFSFRIPMVPVSSTNGSISPSSTVLHPWTGIQVQMQFRMREPAHQHFRRYIYDLRCLTSCFIFSCATASAIVAVLPVPLQYTTDTLIITSL